MKAGDKIKIDFAGKKKDATVDKVFDKTVYLKVDFDKDKQKTVLMFQTEKVALNLCLKINKQTYMHKF